MKVGIMQPYFFPYIGYWQLINAVDTFIVYDNIKYTKKGYINRNNFLINGKKTLFSIPLVKDSDYLNIVDRRIAPEFNKYKLIDKFKNAYFKAPFKDDVLDLIESIMYYENVNLFEYIYNSIVKICEFLNIKAKLIVSSDIDIDHSLKSEQRVIGLCKYMQCSEYINAIGGVKLYDKEYFKKYDIKLDFIKSNYIKYKQYDSEFVPNLSIIDVMMFNPQEKVREMLDDYELVQ